MRVALVLLAIALAGCPSSADEPLGAPGDRDNYGSAPLGCAIDDDCVPAAATCCDCPAFAAHVDEPATRACTGVVCPTTTCADNVRAACDDGTCVLACISMACPTACANGYQMDATGCLSCACAAPASDGCSVDTDCVETRADCCGCASGGENTAVLATEQAAFDAALGCTASPVCPGVDVCDAGAVPTCVQGRCELLATGALPPQACGRPDLPPCPAGTVCTVNVDPTATQQGVGVCGPP